MESGITKITVAGFKSIKKEQSIEVRPLTILAGANSSGKSSIMQPLLLLKQTLEQTFDPGPLWLGGPNVKFSSPDEMLSTGSAPTDSFCVRVDAGAENWHRVCFKKSAMGVNIGKVEFRMGDFHCGPLLPGMLDQELKAHLIGNPWTGNSEEWHWEIARGRCSFDLYYHRKNEAGVVAGMGRISPHIHRLIHIPGQRGNRERTYPATAVPATFPGTFENYAASVILSWQAAGNEQAKKRLDAALKRLGLTSTVEASQLDATQISVLVGRLPARNGNGAKDKVNIADVGFGVSHTLPVLVGLTVATDKNLVYIEEPEAHLHPKAQWEMASVLSDAAKRGVRIVAETHSSILLRGVQTLVASGKLSPDLIKLYWFTRDRKGFTQIHSGELDEDGAFGDWPEDFDDVELGAASKYLNAVETRHARS